MAVNRLSPDERDRRDHLDFWVYLSRKDVSKLDSEKEKSLKHEILLYYFKCLNSLGYHGEFEPTIWGYEKGLGRIDLNIAKNAAMVLKRVLDERIKYKMESLPTALPETDISISLDIAMFIDAEGRFVPLIKGEEVINFEQYIFIMLPLFKGLEYNDIGQCKFCGEVFIQTSKRGRAFCTPTCRVKYTQQNKGR